MIHNRFFCFTMVQRACAEWTAFFWCLCLFDHAYVKIPKLWVLGLEQLHSSTQEKTGFSVIGLLIRFMFIKQICQSVFPWWLILSLNTIISIWFIWLLLWFVNECALKSMFRVESIYSTLMNVVCTLDASFIRIIAKIIDRLLEKWLGLLAALMQMALLEYLWILIVVALDICFHISAW